MCLKSLNPWTEILSILIFRDTPKTLRNIISHGISDIVKSSFDCFRVFWGQKDLTVAAIKLIWVIEKSCILSFLQNFIFFSTIISSFVVKHMKNTMVNEFWTCFAKYLFSFPLCDLKIKLTIASPSFGCMFMGNDISQCLWSIPKDECAEDFCSWIQRHKSHVPGNRECL